MIIVDYFICFTVNALPFRTMLRGTPSTISIDLSLVRGNSFYRTTISQEWCLLKVPCVVLIDPFVILSSDTISISFFCSAPTF